MSYRIAYGRDTGTLEDHTQLVLLDLPKECSDMDTDDLSWFIRNNWAYADFHSQEMVGLTDIIESLKLILPTVQLTEVQINFVIASLNDAITNNDD